MSERYSKTDIQECFLILYRLKLLSRLLVDKTTKSNIIWGTDAYAFLGDGYQKNQEMSLHAVLDNDAGFITARAHKEAELQSQRTKSHAEVFTPVWVCKMMNDYADNDWFGTSNVFDQDKIVFPENKTWKDYVDSRRLEITCGEAPYLVSRYDMSTGDYIPIKERVGILDRKLRVVSENASDENEWLEWALRAYQATYGYEFQGDNLLIARINMIMTLKEYMEQIWNRVPTIEEYRKFINVIAWNIWQMDGLTGTIPYFKAQPEFQIQTLDLFGTDDNDEIEEIHQPYCRIYDWRSNQSIEYIEVKKGGLQNEI